MTDQTPTSRTLLALAVVTAAGMLVGCVTQIEPSSKDRSRAGVPFKPAGGGAPVLPAGPIANPIQGSGQSTRVASALRQLGSIPYDGVTLPHVSPGGTHVFTQTGSIPPWPAILAESDAQPVPGNAVECFVNASGSLSPLLWNRTRNGQPHPLIPDTSGFLLGRCAGDGWTLVERPNPDGSRWIGLLDFENDDFRWLVQGPDVNAQALLMRDGTLAWIRRETTKPTSQLVIRPPVPPNQDAAPDRLFSLDNHYLCQPVLTPDQSTIAILAIAEQTATLIALSTTKIDAQAVPIVIAREPISSLSAALAFQSVTSVEAAPPIVDSPLRSTVLYVNADRRRMVLWDPVNNATTVLPPGVASAARVHGPAASGLAVAAEKGLDFWAGTGMPARLVAGPYIPRSFREATTPSAQAQTGLLLFSPVPDAPLPTLRVVECRLVSPAR